MDCDKIKRLRRAAYKKWEHTSNLEDLISYKRVAVRAKKTFKDKKRECFKKFAESINFLTDSSYAWNKCKIFKNKWPRITPQHWSENLQADSKIEDALNKISPPPWAWLYALIYVDDILIFTRNPELSKQFKQALMKKFNVRDLGNLKYCLGIEVKRENDKINLSQRGYILDILNRFGMKEAKPISTSMSLGTKLSFCTESTDSDEKKSKIRGVPYRELMGALNYLAMATRPDIAHAVSYFSQFQHNHDETHWQAAKRVLRYLRGTLDFGLTYSKDSNPIKGFADADWGGCIIDRKSYSGYAFCLGGAAVSWSSTKQRTVALSSTKAKYVSLSEASREAVQLQGFLRELRFEELSKICIADDNPGALFLARKPVFHNRTKHIDLRHYFIRDAIKEGRVTVDYLPTELMPADVLTKPLPGPKHMSCSLALGVTPGGRGVASATEEEMLEFVAPAPPPDAQGRWGPLPAACVVCCCLTS